MNMVLSLPQKEEVHSLPLLLPLGLKKTAHFPRGLVFITVSLMDLFLYCLPCEIVRWQKELLSKTILSVRIVLFDNTFQDRFRFGLQDSSDRLLFPSCTCNDLLHFHHVIQQVTARRLWKKVYDELGGSPGSTSAATCTRRHYEK